MEFVKVVRTSTYHFVHTLGTGDVIQIQFEDGHMIPAWKWGKAEKHEKLELTPEEEKLQEKIRTIWSGILSRQAIDEHTDFFKSGVGSMDVTRLLEEVQKVVGVEMESIHELNILEICEVAGLDQ